MLKLKKVQILGFKSFCDRTEVQLSGQGMAAVVGPNGCGKSNISDAITWVLGEQSAKSLRGTQMQDVIFAGTRDRKPTGMAEVSLTLVDPEVYDAQSAAPGADDADWFSEVTPEVELAGDWDEVELRRKRADETEEAVLEAQPGLVEGESSPADELSAGTAPDPAAPVQVGVVLKVRRRKFNRAPVRAGEITITRRLFRSGDSEYLLNGKICRLRDIQDIFMGTGLGGETYAIIGQERIGQILSSKPMDRRSILEEAAGITRFKTKKRLAELRLGSAKVNLARVNDIFEEVTRQMAALKRQAAKAERYGLLRDEFRGKLRVVLASRMQQMDAEKASLAEQILALTAQVDAQAADVDAMDAEHLAGVHAGYNFDERIREAGARANSSAVELERVTARIGANGDRVAELAQRMESGAAELDQARQHAQTLAGELEAQRSFVESATQEAAASREAVQGQQLRAQEAVRAVSAAEHTAEQSRRNVMILVQRASSSRNEQAQAEAALGSLEMESERLVRESDAARRELAELGVQRGQAQISFGDVTERLKALETEIAGLQRTLAATREQEAATRREADRLRAQRASLDGRRNSLEALIREHSYSTDTVRNIFKAERNGNGNGLAPVGTLADFLEVEGRYEGVVDEFLRDELNYVVVKSWDAADHGLRMLSSDLAGRATFLVHPEEHGPDHQAAPHVADAPNADGVVALKDCVRVLNGFGRSLEHMLPKLRDGYIAPDPNTARRLALQHPKSFFLSPSGEAFHNATVTGGRVRSQGPLALKRELAEVREQLDAAESALSQIELTLAALDRDLRTLTAALEGRMQERREAERESANSGAALRQMEQETARIERRLQEWTLAAERNRDARNQKQELIARKQQETASLEEQRDTLEREMADLLQQLDGLRAERDGLQHAAAEASAALAALEERRRNAAANFEQTNRMMVTQTTRIQQIESQLHSANAEKAAREQESAELAAQREQLVESRAQAQAEGAALTAEAAELRGRMSELDARLRTLRHETEALREQRAQHGARAAKLESDIEHIEATCINDLGADSSSLREDASIVRLEGEVLATEEEAARALKQKLEQMGPVNMMALEEYNETASRHSFLETQRKDLMDSIENTQASIKEIDDVSRVKFEEAFKVINENFGVTFSKLFGGGQAFMKLTDEENSAESGIDIVASPPGKKLQNVLLLSGGEKALTALSLLVGIFQYQPAPFCVLDEVDAPLDETNVGRFAKLIDEMSQTTQFIVITHSKRTMQQADVIYGVTMQEPGVSKIVSVNLEGRAKTPDRERRAVA